VKRMALVALAVGVAACGSQKIEVSEADRPTAELFRQRCAGCHTLSAVNAQGASTDARTRERKDGPNFDAREVTENCALFAIRNGGFSSGPMPQNIVKGEQARELAAFLAKYSGRDVADDSGPPSEPRDCPA
jgi:mono/diheme cytochrome c family protein